MLIIATHAPHIGRPAYFQLILIKNPRTACACAHACDVSPSPQPKPGPETCPPDYHTHASRGDTHTPTHRHPPMRQNTWRATFCPHEKRATSRLTLMSLVGAN